MKIFDMHADTMMDIANRMGTGQTDVLSRYHLPQYRRGEVGAMIYALWMTEEFHVLAEYFTEPPGTGQETLVRVLGRSFREFRDTDAVRIARCADDIERIQDEGRVAVLLGLEGFYGFNGEIGMIDVLYELGFRHGMLTWNDDNAFASGVEFTGEDRGLSPLGIEAVRRMEELHMLIDVSHASEKTFWDILEHTSCPVIASHSNARALCAAPRNLSDEQIRAIADRGGVIGMNTWKGFLRDDMEKATVADLARHARHMADLVGPEHIACGFDFCDYFDESDGTPGIMNAGESQNFIGALEEEGFTAKEQEAIAWDNAMRVIRAVLG
ncbi:MAG: membrane dipeptidase [Firmicutes bacterium]|nr:membrane dipeptidase [Bacillota bacterium]